MIRQIFAILVAVLAMLLGNVSQARMAPTAMSTEMAPGLVARPFEACHNLAHNSNLYSLCVNQQLEILEGQPARIDAQSNATHSFWRYQAIFATVFLGVAYGLGLLVRDRQWKVGYTRKANALILYFLPYVALQGPSPYTPMITASLSLSVFVLLLMTMSAPIRGHIPALATAFASIDRPEDRPFTLIWLITSVLATWGVLLLWLWLAPETAYYIFVALFISGIGDALAEPVGLRFGRRTYRTRALWTDKTFIRTFEGSATVFLSGVVAVLLVHGLPLGPEAWFALGLFPIAGMLAEAKSPHTWDQPFIVGVCGVVAFAISLIIG